MRLRAFIPALLLPLSLPGQASSTSRAALVARLDSIAGAALKVERLAGMSVAVVLGRDTLLDRGYGHAEIGLGVPATSATTYRLLGPALAAAVMQQVERGRFALDDDASRLIPDFPWQGRHPTLRQLMDASSGLPDFHYLGDAHLATIGVPKAPDEVTALVAGRPFMHEPGASWQWTITGLHFAGLLLERVTGQSYDEYLRTNVFKPAGLKRTYYCDDRTVTPGLAHGYVAEAAGFRKSPLHSATMYPYIATTCTTAAEGVSLARALRDGRLLKTESWRAMTTAVGAARDAGARGSLGVGVRMNDEDGHRWVGQSGSLLGFGSALLDFPEDSLTVVVLTNTSSQASLPIARNLARTVMGLPMSPVPPPRSTPAVAEARMPLAPAERASYVATFRTRPVDPAPQFRGLERTYRVFAFNDRLMIQPLGEEAVPLLRQEGHVFASRIGRVTFTVVGDRATGVEIATGGQRLRGAPVAGP